MNSVDSSYVEDFEGSKEEGQGRRSLIRTKSSHDDQKDEAHKPLKKSRSSHVVIKSLQFSVDLLGFLKDASPSLIDCVGWSQGYLSSQPFLSFIHEEDRESFLESLSHLSSVDSAQTRCRFLCQDRSTKELQLVMGVDVDHMQLVIVVVELRSLDHVDRVLEHLAIEASRAIKTASVQQPERVAVLEQVSGTLSSQHQQMEHEASIAMQPSAQSSGNGTAQGMDLGSPPTIPEEDSGAMSEERSGSAHEQSSHAVPAPRPERPDAPRPSRHTSGQSMSSRAESDQTGRSSLPSFETPHPGSDSGSQMSSPQPQPPPRRAPPLSAAQSKSVEVVEKVLSSAGMRMRQVVPHTTRVSPVLLMDDAIAQAYDASKHAKIEVVYEVEPDSANVHLDGQVAAQCLLFVLERVLGSLRKGSVTVLQRTTVAGHDDSAQDSGKATPYDSKAESIAPTPQPPATPADTPLRPRPPRKSQDPAPMLSPRAARRVSISHETGGHALCMEFSVLVHGKPRQKAAASVGALQLIAQLAAGDEAAAAACTSQIKDSGSLRRGLSLLRTLLRLGGAFSAELHDPGTESGKLEAVFRLTLAMDVNAPAKLPPAQQSTGLTVAGLSHEQREAWGKMRMLAYYGKETGARMLRKHLKEIGLQEVASSHNASQAKIMAEKLTVDAYVLDVSPSHEPPALTAALIRAIAKKKRSTDLVLLLVPPGNATLDVELPEEWGYINTVFKVPKPLMMSRLEDRLLSAFFPPAGQPSESTQSSDGANTQNSIVALEAGGSMELDTPEDGHLNLDDSPAVTATPAALPSARAQADGRDKHKYKTPYKGKAELRDWKSIIEHTQTGLPVAAPSPPPQYPRALVAEDNYMLARQMQKALAQLGIQADLVYDGKAAVDALARRIVRQIPPYDIIFMDVDMPEMNGIEAGTIIKHKYYSCVLVGMSSPVHPQEKAQCIAAGMQDHLMKPVDINALERVVHRWTPQLIDESTNAYSPDRPERRSEPLTLRSPGRADSMRSPRNEPTATPEKYFTRESSLQVRAAHQPEFALPKLGVPSALSMPLFGSSPRTSAVPNITAPCRYPPSAPAHPPPTGSVSARAAARDHDRSSDRHSIRLNFFGEKRNTAR